MPVPCDAYPAMALPFVAAGLAWIGSQSFTSMPALFYDHIAAMFVSWLCMVIASVLYAFNSIWPGHLAKNRANTRLAHGLLGTLSCIAAVVGYGCIYKNHIVQKQSQFGFDPNNPMGKRVHALLGYVVLLWLLLQMVVGWSKFMELRQGRLSYIGHALSGKNLVVLTGVNIATVLTSLQTPLGTTKFWSLVVGVLLVSCSAWLIAERKKAVAAREFVQTEEEEGPMMYKRLPAVGDPAA